jgi:hypothetical protein
MCDAVFRSRSALRRLFVFQACAFNHSAISPFDPPALAHGRPRVESLAYYGAHAGVAGTVSGASVASFDFASSVLTDGRSVAFTLRHDARAFASP